MALFEIERHVYRGPRFYIVPLLVGTFGLPLEFETDSGEFLHQIPVKTVWHLGGRFFFQRPLPNDGRHPFLD